MALSGKGDAEMLKSLCSKTYKAQSIWFLNAFWHLYEKDAENLWKYTVKLATLDLQKGAEGCELDELQMHRFLEHFKETMTVREMRDSLRSTGAISETQKMFPITHYYIFKYKADWHKLVNASQGDNQKEIDEAQAKLDQVQAALKASEQRAKESKAREAESKVKEAEAKAAQVELEAALREVQAQEDEFNRKTDTLRQKSEDEGATVVNRNKAKAELAQHLSSDPLPLRKAKITQEAAVKKAERATKAAIAARQAAEQAKIAAEQAKAAAEAAVEEAERKVEEAEAYLREVKAKPGSAKGQIWFMERELHDAKAYLPERKGGYKKN